VRSTAIVVITVALSACSVLDGFQFGGSSLDPNKVYLSPMTPLTVAPRDTYRYACVGQPLLCVQRGASFECRCP
jgi:hypothetical protein